MTSEQWHRHAKGAATEAWIADQQSTLNQSPIKIPELKMLPFDTFHKKRNRCNTAVGSSAICAHNRFMACSKLPSSFPITLPWVPRYDALFRRWPGEGGGHPPSVNSIRLGNQSSTLHACLYPIFPLLACRLLSSFYYFFLTVLSPTLSSILPDFLCRAPFVGVFAEWTIISYIVGKCVCLSSPTS